MEKYRRFYWIFIAVLFIQVLNLIFKIANPYYFNLLVLAVLTVVVSVLGRVFGIKIGWVVTIAVVILLLITLLTFVVWN